MDSTRYGRCEASQALDWATPRPDWSRSPSYDSCVGVKAAWFERFGPARQVLQVGELPPPSPAAGEVLVRLYTSSVNPSDVKKRAGSIADLLAGGPVIPHSDGAGIVEAVGTGVSSARVGQRVWVFQAQYGRRFGTAAQYVALPAAYAIQMTDDVGFDVGATLGIPAMTAHRCVFADGPVEGQRILVTGGAGRVGFYAIQLAKWGGAETVVATASDEASEVDCRAAGADAVINHRSSDFVEKTTEITAGERFDRVIEVDFGGNLARVLELIRVGGVIATYASGGDPEPKLPFFRMMYMDLTVRMVLVYAMPEAAKRAATQTITALLNQSGLLHRVAQRFALNEIAAAQELVEQGGIRGSVVVDID